MNESPETRCPTPRRYPNVATVAEQVGFPPSTLVGWYKVGSITALEVGGQVLFDASDVRRDRELHNRRKGMPPTCP